MNKTAVVTGGASGIGRRTVERLVGDGWTVWALDISRKALDALEQDLHHRGRYRSRVCDIGSLESVKTCFDSIKAETNSLEALICSAGVTGVGALADLSPEQVDRVIATNFKGVWLSIREALPLLQQNASTAKPTRVVIVGSIGGLRPKVGSGIYCAAKAAAHVLAGIFAMELGPSGILVNVVAPGSVDTPMLQAALEVARSNPDLRWKPSGESPLGRMAQPDDIVDVILFMLSDAARYVNGVVLPVDGGTRAAFVKT